MRDLLDDLARLAETEGVATYGTNLFTGSRPDQPDTVLVLTNYQGPANRLHGDKGIPVDERLAVQVMARAVGYDDAAALAEQAYDALQFRHATLNSGRRYAWSIAQQYPAPVGRDQNGRVLISFNLRLRRHRTDGVE